MGRQGLRVYWGNVTWIVSSRISTWPHPSYCFDAKSNRSVHDRTIQRHRIFHRDHVSSNAPKNVEPRHPGASLRPLPRTRSLACLPASAPSPPRRLHHRLSLEAATSCCFLVDVSRLLLVPRSVAMLFFGLLLHWAGSKDGSRFVWFKSKVILERICWCIALHLLGVSFMSYG